jgi:hypothetical protein
MSIYHKVQSPSQLLLYSDLVLCYAGGFFLYIFFIFYRKLCIVEIYIFINEKKNLCRGDVDIQSIFDLDFENHALSP